MVPPCSLLIVSRYVVLTASKIHYTAYVWAVHEKDFDWGFQTSETSEWIRFEWGYFFWASSYADFGIVCGIRFFCSKSWGRDSELR